MGIFNKTRPIKIGVVFGGGGSRGYGHIGVVKALEESGIKPDIICGTSIGAIVGAAYANGMTADEMIGFARTIKQSDIKRTQILPTPTSAKRIEELVVKFLGGDKMFSELTTPFYAVAVNIKTSKQKVFESGFVAKSVSASCAVPMFFNPVQIEEEFYVDGGLLNTIPTSVAKEKFCDFIIGVDINPSRGYGSKSTKMFDVLLASVRIMMASNTKPAYEYADVMVKLDLKKYKSTKLEFGEEMIDIGYHAAKKMMPEILEKIKNCKSLDLQLKKGMKNTKRTIKNKIKEYRNFRDDE